MNSSRAFRNFFKKYPSIFNSPFILLDTAAVNRENQKTYLFNNFQDILIFKPQDDLEIFFRKVENYHRKGYWLAGYFAYEFGAYLEPVLFPFRKNPYVPLVWLGVCRQPLTIKRKVFLKEDRLADYKITRLQANLSYKHYSQQIAKIKYYLKEGLTYQVNYTFKVKFSFKGEALRLYFDLRRLQPTSYGAFLNLGNIKILSFSPELFFRINGTKIITRPMKGTSPRGSIMSEDLFFKKTLQEDSKTKAENLMIVDLLRNDLGRISKEVATKSLFDIEKHKTLYQMTSTIEAKLKDNLKQKEIFSALFPCGSVTGAPKIKTMQIISKLEKEPRNTYTGAIGYIAPDKSCFNVAIRTVQIKGGQGELGIGGGIVYDSIAKKEYQEAILKAKFFKENLLKLCLIESILWDKNKGFFLLGLHLKRLKRSCRYFAFSFRLKEIKKSLRQAIENEKANCKIRLLLRRDGQIKINKSSLSKIKAPVKIKLSRYKTNPDDIFLYHKTTRRKLYDQERVKAQKEGFFEAIFLNKNNELTEGSITNIFILKNNSLYTPSLASGLLAGTLREYLIKEKRVKEIKLYLKDLLSAEKVYVGNSLRGLLEADIEQVRGSGIISKI
ncbi:MAG: aminodeoxychorismate synthase component I [Candidatus Omnitrophica bacterium]|jgi:para-aminobenzoate synthetase/4-amino-4-deoxychorismate lyase|nr:aminodeoxychorismate synthase component I [Candidatus Omnitrophota bacterium]